MLDNFDGLLNWDNLQAWIETQDIPGKGPVTAVEKLVGGSQNNLFLMTRGPRSSSCAARRRTRAPTPTTPCCARRVC